MHNNVTEPNYEQEYEQRFAWRKAGQIANLKELSKIAQSSGSDAMEALPGLIGSRVSDDPKDALRWSILTLWLEATECYIFELFESCILTCGAIVERCLKLEYEKAKGPLPSESRWTLGVCIRKCKGIIAPDILDLARQILEPRNSRAHALLEHSDPQLAIIGGPERGIEVLSPQRYLIEPYRGEARKVIEITSKILSKLYGVESLQSTG
jgi:hypothetical protein